MKKKDNAQSNQNTLAEFWDQISKDQSHLLKVVSKAYSEDKGVYNTELQSFSADFLNIIERDILSKKGNR